MFEGRVINVMTILRVTLDYSCIEMLTLCHGFMYYALIILIMVSKLLITDTNSINIIMSLWQHFL